MNAECAATDRTLYVTDLDGTLLNPEGEVSPETRATLNTAIAEGALVSVATARTPATISRLLAGIDLRLPMTVMTGAALWDMKSGRYSNVRYMSEETARRLTDIYLQTGLPTFIYTLGEDMVIHIYHLGKMDTLARRFMEERINNPYKRFHVDDEGESREMPPFDRVLLFLTMRPTDETKAVYDRIRREVDCRPIFYHDMYGDEVAELEVFAPSASKAAGVREIAEIAEAGRVVVFGDNVNDLPMLETADRGVAVANAVEEVKESADEVIGSNAENSVARYILDHTRQSR